MVSSGFHEASQAFGSVLSDICQRRKAAAFRQYKDNRAGIFYRNMSYHPGAQRNHRISYMQDSEKYNKQV